MSNNGTPFWNRNNDVNYVHHYHERTPSRHEESDYVRDSPRVPELVSELRQRSPSATGSLNPRNESTTRYEYATRFRRASHSPVPRDTSVRSSSSPSSFVDNRHNGATSSPTHSLRSPSPGNLNSSNSHFLRPLPSEYTPADRNPYSPQAFSPPQSPPSRPSSRANLGPSQNFTSPPSVPISPTSQFGNSSPTVRRTSSSSLGIPFSPPQSAPQAPPQKTVEKVTIVLCTNPVSPVHTLEAELYLGTITLQASGVTIDINRPPYVLAGALMRWEDGERLKGNEFTDLCWWQGFIHVGCDQTGVIYRCLHPNSVNTGRGRRLTLHPMSLLNDGDGFSDRPFRIEWMTATSDGMLLVGSHGTGHKPHFDGRRWAKAIAPNHRVENLNWGDTYDNLTCTLIGKLGAANGGYVAIEACVYDSVEQSWYIAPRRISAAPNADQPESLKGCCVLVHSPDISFHPNMAKTVSIGDYQPFQASAWGFSSISPIPLPKYNHLLAGVLSWDGGDSPSSRIVVFEKGTGNVVAQCELPNVEAKGIEILTQQQEQEWLAKSQQKNTIV